MAFSTFLKVIWARKWFITSFVFVICLLIGVKSIFAAKQYEATASIIINVNGKDPITGAMVPTLMQPAFLATQGTRDLIFDSGAAHHMIGQKHMTEDEKSKPSGS